MQIESANALKKLPPYLFVEIDKAKRQARAEGKDLIDLGIGDPDTPTPKHIIESLYKAAKDPANHRYALDAGMPAFKNEIALWHKKRFKVTLDAQAEILPLLGSKEGLAHTPFAFLNKSDVALVPDPAYPAYRNATILAGGTPYFMPLFENNAFLPDLKKIPASVLKKTKLMFLNYPNNPTGAVAPKRFLQEVVKFAQKNKIIICFDMAYSEMCYDNYSAPSIFEISGAKEVAVEYHSLSKTYNMTGWRLGWVCGNKDIVAPIAKFKSNMDSGVFQAVQVAGITALKTKKEFLEKMCKMYEERRDILVSGLEKLGWSIKTPKATFYLWTKIPHKMNSMALCSMIMEKAGIVATPGVGFGKFGEGYVRFALTQDKKRIKEAVKRLSFL
ncbi:MAG: LL-diaminopimelate aminotransferase [Candidatus Omnitrophica bacterium]|nr:LL-diaminopimelate aminotransferase [Candidatus Omnitrophota bacterium]